MSPAVHGRAMPALRGSLARCAIVLWVAGAPDVAPAAEHSHTVKMEGTAFAPATLTLRRGERVTWKNQDPFPHTATATATGNAKPAFDSGSVGEGKSWSWVARSPGTYDYVCSLHPGMKGRLIVE